MGGGISRMTGAAANNSSANLKKALTAYNAALRNANKVANLAGAINKNINVNGTQRKISNLIKNGISKYGQAIYKGHAAAAEAAALAAAGATPPAEPLNNAAKRLEALNAYYASTLAALVNNNARANKYLANRNKNYNNNKAANNARNGGGKYANLWAAVSAKRTAGAGGGNFTPANQNINASGLIGYKLQANGSYMKVQRSAANATNWARANNKSYNKNASGIFTEK